MLPPQIPAYPRSTRKRHDRPVTPEVAGSSPVAPVFICRGMCGRGPGSRSLIFWQLDSVGDDLPLLWERTAGRVLLLPVLC
jgi:hypothetical protein